MDDWFAQTAFSGSMVLAIPVAVAGRAGLLLLPVRASRCCPATCRTRPACPAPTSPTPRPTPRRGRMLAGSLLFVLGFSVVFVGLGVLSASVSRWFFENARTLDDRARRVRDRARAGLHGTGAAVPARRPGPRGARRRTGRGAAARLPVRAGLDALHRPDAGRHPHPGELRERRAAGACCSRSTRWGSASRSSSPALAWRRALGAISLGAPAPAVGDPGWAARCWS